jgi:predicted phosphohydrolase
MAIRIYIDQGHNPVNPNAGAEGSGYREQDLVYEIGVILADILEENGFETLSLLYNNAYAVEDFIVCGTRGWFLEKSQQQTVGEVDYEKIVNREVGRLRMSLEAARALQREQGELEIIPFLHFPPVFGEFQCLPIMQLLSDYGVRRCYYGHIHTPVLSNTPAEIDGIHYILCAADHLRFTPMPVFPTEKYHMA